MNDAAVAAVVAAVAAWGHNVDGILIHKSQGEQKSMSTSGKRVASRRKTAVEIHKHGRDNHLNSHTRNF